MTFFFKKFIEKNNISLNKKKSDKNIIIVDRGKFGSAMFSSLIALAVNYKYKHNIKVLTSINKSADISNFYRSFGINDFIYGLNLDLSKKNIYYVFLTFFYFIKSSLIISFNSFDWFVDKFEVRGIKVGDLIYDSYIKEKRRYIKPKKDIYFFFLLLRTTFKVIKILSLTKKLKVKCIIIGTLSYANNDAIFLRVGVREKIKVLESGYFHDINTLIEYDNDDLMYGPRHIHYDKIQKKKLNKIETSNNILNKFIEDRFDNKIKLFHTNKIDVKLANKTKIKLSRNNFLKNFGGKTKFKKIIIFAPHAFSDAPHGGGYKLCFKDFYSYFTETIDKIVDVKNKDVLWLIRPHPLSIKYGEKNVVEDYLKKFDHKNMILCPKGLSTKNLINICDTVVTCKGTIGLEFAALGKMPITCGYPPYSNFGISIDANSKEKYFNTLRNAHKINYKLSEKKQFLAKKILYYMETVIPYKEMSGSQNFQDLLLDLNSNKTDLSWKKLSNRLSKNNGFLNDNFYLDCLKEL